MDTLNVIVIIAVGIVSFILGLIIAWLFTQNRGRDALEGIRIELAQYKTRAAELQGNLEALRPQYEQLQQEANNLRIQVAEAQKVRESDNEKLLWLENAQGKMREAFEALAARALQNNSQEFLKNSNTSLNSLVHPLKENLNSLAKQVQDLEVKREGAYKGLEQQLTELARTHTILQRTTVTLTQALRSPTVRGKWGEMQLKRVVEMAGMVKNISYAEQVSTDAGRPDMIVYLPNNGILPLDSKVPLEAYLDAVESRDTNERKSKLVSHAKAMKDRARELGKKQYWDQFDQAPDFVVMFVPNEACLGAAFDFDPHLLDFALEQKVLITTPVTLLALLKAVAFGWQQHQITENSRKIAEHGKELYQRMSVLIEHISDLGKNLNKTVDSFNKTVGSFESRLLPSARRFEELGIAVSEVSLPEQVEKQVRIMSD